MKNIQEIKRDFPILSQKINGRPFVYLDNAATSQKPKQVINKITQYYEETNSNIHRGIHALAEKATQEYERTRSHVASFINASSADEIVFTKNATESINLVASTWAQDNILEGDEIIVTALEHHANLVPWQELAKRKNATLKIVPITEDFLLDIEVFNSMLSERTKLVCVTAMSNVTGTITPIRDIVKKSHEKGAIILVDGAQSVGHVPTDVQADDVDFLVFSAHKMMGPTGVGVLYGKKELLNNMRPYYFGGDMVEEVGDYDSVYKRAPMRFEAGTPNIADVIAFDTSISYLESIGIDAVARHGRELLDYAIERFSQYSFVKLFAPKNTENSGAILSFSVEGVHSHDIATVFDQHGVAIRVGYHCAQPLVKKLTLLGTARMSFYIYNTKEDIDMAEEALKKVVEIFKLQ